MVHRRRGWEGVGIPGAPGLLADDLRSAAQFLKEQGDVASVPTLSHFRAALANQYVAQAAGK